MIRLQRVVVLVHSVHVASEPFLTVACSVATRIKDCNQVCFSPSSGGSHESKSWIGLVLKVGDKFLQFAVLGLGLSQAPGDIGLFIVIHILEGSAFEFSK